MIERLLFSNANAATVVHGTFDALREAIDVPVCQVATRAFLDKGGLFDFADTPRVLDMCWAYAGGYLRQVGRW